MNGNGINAPHIWEGKTPLDETAFKRMKEGFEATLKSSGGETMVPEYAIVFHHQTGFFTVSEAHVYRDKNGFAKSDGFVQRMVLHPTWPVQIDPSRLGEAPMPLWEGKDFPDAQAWDLIHKTAQMRIPEPNGGVIEVEVALVFDSRARLYRAFSKAYYRNADGRALSDGFVATAGFDN